MTDTSIRKKLEQEREEMAKDISGFRAGEIIMTSSGSLPGVDGTALPSIETSLYLHGLGDDELIKIYKEKCKENKELFKRFSPLLSRISQLNFSTREFVFYNQWRDEIKYLHDDPQEMIDAYRELDSNTKEIHDYILILTKEAWGINQSLKHAIKRMDDVFELEIKVHKYLEDNPLELQFSESDWEREAHRYIERLMEDMCPKDVLLNDVSYILQMVAASCHFFPYSRDSERNVSIVPLPDKRFAMIVWNLVFDEIENLSRPPRLKCPRGWKKKIESVETSIYPESLYEILFKYWDCEGQEHIECMMNRECLQDMPLDALLYALQKIGNLFFSEYSDKAYITSNIQEEGKRFVLISQHTVLDLAAWEVTMHVEDDEKEARTGIITSMSQISSDGSRSMMTDMHLSIKDKMTLGHLIRDINGAIAKGADDKTTIDFLSF